MASTRYRYFNTVWNDEMQHTMKGFPTNDLFTTFNFSDDIRYRIPLKFQYRPDLIANQFYGDSRLFWVLVYANGFSNSPQDFETTTVIRVPRYERVIDVV